jgi:hypothetical protein
MCVCVNILLFKESREEGGERGCWGWVALATFVCVSLFFKKGVLWAKGGGGAVCTSLSAFVFVYVVLCVPVISFISLTSRATSTRQAVRRRLAENMRKKDEN